MKIISFVAIKGGVGKTTLCFNYGEWLASKGKNVLMIDSDHQCSLTQTYDIYTDSGTVSEIFKPNSKPEIIKIKENLSLIPSDMLLDRLNDELQTKPNKELMAYMWIADNYDELSKYDYIIIDCHPDFSTVTQNMIAISDILYSPIEPSEYGFRAKQNLTMRLDHMRKEVIDVMSRKSFVTADLNYIGNRVKHNTSSSREFIEIMEKDKDTIALIPERELFNKSTLNHKSIFDNDTSKLTNSEIELVNKMNNLFEQITE